MKIIGVDLSGPRNLADTCLVIFEESEGNLHFVESFEGVNNRQILEVVSGLGRHERIVIGIDAPLSYNPGGGDRASDRELRKLALPKGKVGIMPPTMVRMVYLTLRGISLTRGLEALRPDYHLGIIEIHPGACLLLRGADPANVAGFKHDPASRLHILEWLAENNIRKLPEGVSVSDHFVAACAAAYGTWQWALGKPIWCFPAAPPEHPYDLVC